jgi:HAD superfamily hydrolase (TIGR01450 family)
VNTKTERPQDLAKQDSQPQSDLAKQNLSSLQDLAKLNPQQQKNLARLKKIKCFLFDMDGTINLGEQVIPGMEGFFEKLTAAGRKYFLVTNNSSRDHAHYVRRMNGMGVPVTRENILISTDAMVTTLQHLQPGARLFVLGTPELKRNIAAGGFKLTTTLEEGADYVVVGFDQTLTYANLTIACRLIDRGVPYVATHPDVRCPIEGRRIYPGHGRFFGGPPDGHRQKTAVHHGETVRIYGRHGDGTDRFPKKRDCHGGRPVEHGYCFWHEERHPGRPGFNRGSHFGGRGGGSGETGCNPASCQRDFKISVNSVKLFVRKRAFGV